ncbi:MAG: acyl-CoA dehydrogenase family protein [Acidobacteria bacterium]|nr:acyl-CoA dehydrogenase family protein [Acidobacteriota bacterium]MCB9397303.1 acyl-CoA dehydrogenase family protein [Acidobacteriota bacterium]
MAEFFQTEPLQHSPYQDTDLLFFYLKQRLPQAYFDWVHRELVHLSDRAVGEMAALALEAERDVPRHIPFDPWGRRVDEIRVSPAWNRLGAIAAEEGVVAEAYERRFGEWSRLVQMAKLLIYHPYSAIFSCPLAMTDGAARLIEVHGDDTLRERVFPHLVTRHADQFWTSGQWMTERIGGSDVGQSETRAVWDGSTWRLYGTKWFSSATTSEIAFTLARPEGAAEGSKGLSLFFVQLRNGEGQLDGIEVLRLKDKLGTRALPTAELKLNGVPAKLVGGEGKGVARIATLFNITRIYNAICAVGYMREALAVSQAYSRVRFAFGKPISEHPLHQRTLVNMEAATTLCFFLSMELAIWQGREACGLASESQQKLLRVLTPVAKLFTAKQCVQVVSEGLECLGGTGYIEDSGLPRLLRNAQVLPIWEGTTNILSLDMVRALIKDQAWPDLREFLSDPALKTRYPYGERLLDQMESWVNQVGQQPELEAEARHFALLLGQWAGTMLMEQFVAEGGVVPNLDLIRDQLSRWPWRYSD